MSTRAVITFGLRTLLSEQKRPKQEAFRFAPSHKPLPNPGIVKIIERAQRYRRRAAIEYRAASRGGAPATVHVEPLLINVADGDPYVRAVTVQPLAPGAEREVRGWRRK